MNRMHSQRGVTLIELVVVMIIIGILTAIAVPSYRNYVLRSQRSDAKDAVLALATQEEKHYLQCNTYATSIAGATNCAAGQLQGAAVSKNGWYALTMPVPGTATTYTVQATAVAGQNQFQDTACRSFTVTQAGVRSALDSGGADNTAECWR
ncbi:MAG TPA: type IV pilin protein [Steroidobacteraceae bacterium]|jgi:type IV pilus assembly protein PilE